MNTTNYYPVPELYDEMRALESTINNPVKRQEFRTGVLGKLRTAEKVNYSDNLEMISVGIVEEIWRIADQILDESDRTENDVA